MEELLNNQAGPAEESLPAASEPADAIAVAVQLVRRHPLGAAVLVFGGSVLIGWLIGHDLKKRFYSRGKRARQKLGEAQAYHQDISHWEDEGGSIPLTNEVSEK